MSDLSDSYNLTVKQIQSFDFGSFDWKNVKKLTQEDELLNKIIRSCTEGWPERQPDDDVLKTFWLKRDALTVDRGCLPWGHRVVIPEKLRPLVLKELHGSHFGVSRMKELARSFVWWPHVDLEIERITRECKACLETRKLPPKIPLTPWVWPLTPWHRVHADILGPFHGETVLVVIDSHSKWPEAFQMSSMSEKATIEKFESLFITFRYPVHVVTDNYSTFKSKAFEQFMKRGGIRHSTTPTYFPATNGAAENFVDTFKRKVTCLLESGYKFASARKQFLFDYRNTPHAATGKTPVKLMFGRELRTRFSLLRPPAIEERIANYQAR